MTATETLLEETERLWRVRPLSESWHAVQCVRSLIGDGALPSASLKDFRSDHVARMVALHGSKAAAARALGCNVKTVYSHLRRNR